MWIYVGLIFCSRFSGSSDTSANHPVRLAGGVADNEGRVEIYSGGKWGAVGDEGWDMADANVVCKELGFPQALEIIRHLMVDYLQVFLSSIFQAAYTTAKKHVKPQDISSNNILGVYVQFVDLHGEYIMYSLLLSGQIFYILFKNSFLQDRKLRYIYF